MKKEKNINNNLENVWGLHAKNSTFLSPAKDDNFIQDPIKKWIPKSKNKNKKLLDAGCGIGQYLDFTKKQGIDSIGLEISSEAAKIGIKKGHKIIIGDMRKMPFKNKEFDIVIAGGSIEHFKETSLGFSEISRVLKKDGYLLFNVPYRYGLFTLAKLVQQVFGIWRCGYEKSFSKRSIKKYLTKNNLIILEIARPPYLATRKIFIAKLLEILDKLSLKVGLGGPHIFLKCKKIK